ncbi:YpmS family protein [Evansella halocellulosilytica]|uniref:YpmS family protein n=1 Tax=Evansella halocellulosilytica TaxID=2011013 RepID=UPI000BB87690|nr:YpmS family protein [Evansella halocellulosilytica]
MNVRNWNHWKIAFFSLISLIFLVITIGIIWLNQALNIDEYERRDIPLSEDAEGSVFHINTEKEDVNYWLQQQLEEETENEFNLFLDDDVYFQTTINVYNMNIPIEMALTPAVTEAGNIELEEQYFRAGALELPSEHIFRILQSTVDFPEWIEVHPSERKLYINVRDEISENVQIKVQTFDLEENRIEIEVVLQ